MAPANKVYTAKSVVTIVGSVQFICVSCLSRRGSLLTGNSKLGVQFPLIGYQINEAGVPKGRMPPSPNRASPVISMLAASNECISNLNSDVLVKYEGS